MVAFAVTFVTTVFPLMTVVLVVYAVEEDFVLLWWKDKWPWCALELAMFEVKPFCWPF